MVSSGISPLHGHILIGHTHWDHIQGFPFFAPLFKSGNEWHVYGPRGLGSPLRESLSGQMQSTYFPITLKDLDATLHYHDLVEGTLEVGDIHVTTQYLNHPALTLGYRLEADGVTVVYSTDHEPHTSPRLAGTGAPLAGQDLRHAQFPEMAGPEPVHPLARAFVRGLRALGYVEGQNLILDRRSAEGRFERFGAIVAELVRLKANVIVTVGNAMARAAKTGTTTVPVVMAVSSEPVVEGLVQSLAQPGGNITGLTRGLSRRSPAESLRLSAIAKSACRVIRDSATSPRVELLLGQRSRASAWNS